MNDAAFRIQERLLREARQSLADTKEVLAQAHVVRRERDALIGMVEWREREIKVQDETIQELLFDKTNAANSLAMREQLIDILKRNAQK